MRSMARQNLLVASVNAAIEQGLITLECEPVMEAAFEFDIGGYPALASIDDAGFDEVAIKAIVCPTKLGRKFVHCAVLHEWRRFGEATAFAWLERRTGKYLQSGVNYHGTRAVTERLSKFTIMPLGFGIEPTKTGYDVHKEFEAVFGRARATP
jgi:hypothetical protein